jgi:hypothetical protein
MGYRKAFGKHLFQPIKIDLPKRVRRTMRTHFLQTIELPNCPVGPQSQSKKAIGELTVLGATRRRKIEGSPPGIAFVPGYKHLLTEPFQVINENLTSKAVVVRAATQAPTDESHGLCTESD